MAIDMNAMYKAGFSSGSSGRNKENEAKVRRQEFWSGVGKQAYSILGTAAIGQIKQNYKGLQKFRNAADSQIGMNTLQVNKMPKNNPELRQNLADLGAKFGAAAKAAHYGVGKKRSKGRQDAEMYMQQLKDMNTFLSTVAESTVEAQGMVAVASGKIQAQSGQANMSSGASQYAIGNTIALAEGSLGQRIRWNTSTGQGEVLVGGEWRKDKDGNNSYQNKTETGTYEDYAAENSEMKKKLFEKFKASSSSNWSYEEWESSQGESIVPSSREEWTKQNQENLGVVSRSVYGNLKFAEKEDKTFGDDLNKLDATLTKQAFKKDSLDWEFISETNTVKPGKKQFEGAVNGYSDLQFRDFFFGGHSFDHSSNRMSETAPAHILLKAEDEKDGNLNEDGSFKKGFGPGNKDWEGRLLSLRGQSFVSGSYYRVKTIEQQWDIRREKYQANQKRWRDAHPEEVKIPNQEIVDVMAGVNGYMFNPATGEDNWVGRKREKGKLTKYGAYDYDANNDLLEANKSFPDMWGNIYEPEIVGRSGRVVKWKVKKAGSGKYIEDKEGKTVQYSAQQARKNAFGGTYKSSSNIG
tara:strand:- start:353 stop:2089 length:1737 start_codon:yes stop_codon:yes gene_type:complete